MFFDYELRIDFKRGDDMSEIVKRSKKSQMKKRDTDWDDMKMEIAKEIGLWDKVRDQGWAGLSAVESGRIGGIFSRRQKEQKEGGNIADSSEFSDEDNC
ncbi:MAG: alpha/beta-type small acid-soluble spore protein [Clostridiales bacterium]|nr:alpha/beta-type small acid-soluble spore protein [Clostridiales bacterium]